MHPSLRFIILLGIVSLFADVTYEGAKSITGQYLATLGATGTAVGVIAGLGEWIGYAFRFVSGFLADKTRRYWLITIIGYIVNLIAVPLLALAGSWQVAAALIILERFGKAIRSPAKDTILSYATLEVGRGWGFGMHEAMDQTGAILGPLLMAAVLYFQGTYRMGFAILLIPALLALATLAASRILYPHPEKLESRPSPRKTEGLTPPFWIYVAAASFVGAGFVDFPLISYHFEKIDTFNKAWIPLFFSIAMGAAGLSALFFGKLYDLKGISVLAVATGISSLFAPLVFADGFYFSLFGMILWGIGLGSQESIMRAAIANLVHIDERGTAYGILNMGFGTFWFLGSALMGYLYDVSIPALIAFSVGMQLAAIPLFLYLMPKQL